MSSRTYVCFPCRWARRAPFVPAAAPRCVHCRQDLTQLDRRWRIPGRDDLRGWRRLTTALALDARAQRRPEPPALDAALNTLDRQLANALRQPESARLYWRLRALRARRRKRLRQRRG